MNLRLLSWNVRGLNNPRKRQVCKNLLKEWNCDVVCFQETKVASIDIAFVQSYGEVLSLIGLLWMLSRLEEGSC